MAGSRSDTGAGNPNYMLIVVSKLILVGVADLATRLS